MDLPLDARQDSLPDEISYRHKRPALIVTLGLIVIATVGALQFNAPGGAFDRRPFGSFLSRSLPLAAPSASAYGESGGVLFKFALPGQSIKYPLDVHGDPTSLHYSWVRIGETSPSDSVRALAGADVQVPSKAGFYRLALVRGDNTRIVEGLTVAVLVPFKEKDGAMLNGYKIGTYLAEKVAGNQEPPEGFLEIRPGDLNLQVSKHLKVGDFVNHDGQDTWPQYTAVNPRLLDKIELVITELARWHGGTPDDVSLSLDVRSGFRAPAHNRQVRRAARDSQHQYGDAADVAIDANGDGRYSAVDSRMVGLAVEIVELKHPDLVGGLGIYTSGHTRTTYVHIDARGKRARWRG
jgi:uncharacterized protein YcbK (DUF882 family)